MTPRVRTMSYDKADLNFLLCAKTVEGKEKNKKKMKPSMCFLILETDKVSLKHTPRLDFNEIVGTLRPHLVKGELI